MSKFSERFKLLKEERKLTLKEISEGVDVTVSNLSYYMKGREPNYDILMRVANYFEVTVDWLIGNTDYRTVQSKENFSIIKNKVDNYFDSDVELDNSYLDKIDVLENRLVDIILTALSNERKKNNYGTQMWRMGITPVIDGFFDVLSILTELVNSNDDDYVECDTKINKILGTMNTINTGFKNTIFQKMQQCLLDENVEEPQKINVIFILKKYFVNG